MQPCIIEPSDCDVFIDSDVLDRFYPPAEYSALSGLVAEHDATRQRIEEVHATLTQERVSGVLGYFFAGNCNDQYGGRSSLRHTNAFAEVFVLEGALNELTSTFWQRTLELTNLWTVLPQERRREWNDALNAWRESGYKRGADPKRDLPEFNQDNLTATVQSLMARRSEFVAERVDGVFRALSKEHLTNRPEGFCKYMIVANMYNEWGNQCWELRGYLQDLRLVIAKFMGRDEPDTSTAVAMLNTARANCGQWIECDAGSLRIKAFLKGTLHLEVHPEMAWRLNAILANLYPAAIPDSSRRPAPRTGKGFHAKPLFDRPLSNALLACLAGLEGYYYLENSSSTRWESTRVPLKNTLCLRPSDPGKHLKAELNAVLSSLGGVLTRCSKHTHMSYWQFDYCPTDVIREVLAYGAIPDQKSHQYYPTPEPVVQALLDMAGLDGSDMILEPSAGQGAISDYLPRDQTLSVEVSPLHCAILKKKGHRVIEADFLDWVPGTDFTAILMNPPFSEGRWQAHLKKAVSHLAPAGRVLAVLPASAKNSARGLLPGYHVEFGQTFDNAFAGTSIRVVLVKVTRVG